MCLCLHLHTGVHAGLPGACGSEPAWGCIAVTCCGMRTALYEPSEPKPQIRPVSKPLGITGCGLMGTFPKCQPSLWT